MTDNEIVKVFRECCVKLNGNFCDECPYNKGMCNDIQMATDILDLINRLQARVKKCEKVERFADKTIATLQAENERLKAELEKSKVANSLFSMYVQTRDEVITEAKAEAYKEIIGFLENRLAYKRLITQPGYECAIIEIKNRLKELLGEQYDEQ